MGHAAVRRATIAILAIPAGATAQPLPGFAAIDANADGRASKAEFRQSLRPLFAGIDRDRSGGLSRSELFSMARRMPPGDRPAGGPPPRPVLNDKGEVGFEAFAAMIVAARFDRFDRNRDGLLSRQEYRAGQ